MLHSKRLGQSPVLSRRMSGDEVLVMAVGGTGVVSLTGTSLHLWSELEQPLTFDRLVGRLASRFEADSTVIEGLARRAIDDLLAAGVVTADA